MHNLSMGENHLPSEYNFDIHPDGPVSKVFIGLGIHTFTEAIDYLRRLPYGRNSNKENLLTVFTDGTGTCSTKHALLKQLATENNVHGIHLKLGIMKMNEQTLPEVTNVLSYYKLNYVPEAHNYLKVGEQIIDCTKRHSRPDNFIHELLAEIEITPSQITAFKVDFHQQFLKTWLQDHPEIPYSLAEFWEIREECIQALTDN